MKSFLKHFQLCTVSLLVLGGCKSRGYNTVDANPQDFSANQNAKVWVFWTVSGQDVVFRAPCIEGSPFTRTVCGANGITQTKLKNFRKHLYQKLKIEDSDEVKGFLGRINELVSQNDKIKTELQKPDADVETLNLQLKSNEDDIKKLQQNADLVRDTALDRNETAQKIFSGLNSDIAVNTQLLQPGDMRRVVFESFTDMGDGSEPLPPVPPDNPIGPKNFVLIKAGTFTMGSPTTEAGRSSNEGPQHQVTIPKDFEIGKFEVTQQEWFDVMGANPSNFTTEANCPGERKIVNNVALCPNNPVEQVSWNDVQTYIAKLKEKGLGNFRLPTESEWEYAARGGTQTAYSFGDDASKLGDFAWFISNSGSQSHPVGKKLPNAFGLFDMAGNVWEWTKSDFDNYPSTPVTDNPDVPNAGSVRVDRGGGWFDFASTCRAANRSNNSSGNRNVGRGFRLVRLP